MMKALSLAKIAARNVLRNQRRTAITLAALVLGVGVMITVRGLLNGLQHSLVDGVVHGQTGALQVHRKGYLKNVLASPLTLDFEDAPLRKKVAAVSGVKAVAPRILFPGMISLGDETIFLLNQAVDPALEFEVCPNRRPLIVDGGKFASAEGGKAPAVVADAMVVTVELDRALRAKPAATGPAALLAPDRDGALSGENVSLVGTMQLNSPGERKIGMVRLDVAQRLLKLEGRVTELIVDVHDLQEIPQVAAAIQAVVGPEFEVHTWEQVAPFVVDIRARQNAVLQIVAAVFLLLMLLGVANTMLMSVLDRTREIGTMMAIGVRRRTIVGLFLLEATLIGALGGLLGGAAGAGMTAWLGARGLEIPSPGSNVATIVRPFVGSGYLVGVVLLATAGALLFALYPAWRASRLRPVQALAGG